MILKELRDQLRKSVQEREMAKKQLESAVTEVLMKKLKEVSRENEALALGAGGSSTEKINWVGASELTAAIEKYDVRTKQWKAILRIQLQVNGLTVGDAYVASFGESPPKLSKVDPSLNLQIE